MQIDEYTCIFFQMEMEERFFFSRTPNGDPFWDVVRHDVFYSFYYEINGLGQLWNPPAIRAPHSWLTKMYDLPLKIGSMVNRWTRLKRIGPVDFVAFVCSRYKDVNDKQIDFASDDAVHRLSEIGSIQKIESQSNLLRDNNFNTLISLATRAYHLPADFEQYFRDVAKAITDAERNYFGVVDPHLFDVICKSYINHFAERRIWREILDRSQPRLVLMVQNGIQKGLIYEARKRHVPVVECQHGVINLEHPAYSYPLSLSPGEAVILPDVLLLFSEYWKRQCYMPGTKLVAVGNNHFSNSGSHSTRTGAAVFMSAGPFHKLLSPFAVELAQSMPNQAFIMKLHPTQLSDRAVIEKEYQQIKNLVVIGMEKSISEIMDDASDVIIIDSTSLYEALDRGVPIHFLRKGPYMSYRDLFSRSDVHLFTTVEELQSALFNPMKRPESVLRFFDAFDPVAFSELVRTLHS
jgi:hypothetical protein